MGHHFKFVSKDDFGSVPKVTRLSLVSVGAPGRTRPERRVGEGVRCRRKEDERSGGWRRAWEPKWRFLRSCETRESDFTRREETGGPV